MSAFAKSDRRKIFYGMVILFILVAPVVILYSQGYVFDFRTGGLIATGGIFVKTEQTDAEIFLDATLEKQTSFISRGVLMPNLIPRRYQVRVTKSGYQDWEKTVSVTDSEVTEFRHVFLPAATATPSAIYRLRSQIHGAITELAGRSDIAVAAGDPAKPVTVSVIDPNRHAVLQEISRAATWSWDRYAQSFVIGRVASGATKWYRFPASDGSAKEELMTFKGLPRGFSATHITLHPIIPSYFYFFAGGALFLQTNASVPVPIAEQIYTYAITADHIYYISNNGFFVKSDLNGQNTQVLGRKGLFLTTDQPPKIIVGPGGDAFVIDSAGGLFHYQPDRDQELELVAGNVHGVDFPATKDRMLFWEDHRLWVYWLRDNPEQPFDLAGTKRQIFTSDDPITYAAISSEGTYAFYATPHEIRMVETDDRGGVNAYQLVQGNIDSFLLDRENLILYWIDGAAVWRASIQ